MTWQEYFQYICRRQRSDLASFADRNNGILISPWYTKPLVFTYLSLLLTLRVLIIYNENGHFLMLRTSPYAYRQNLLH